MPRTFPGTHSEPEAFDPAEEPEIMPARLFDIGAALARRFAAACAMVGDRDTAAALKDVIELHCEEIEESAVGASAADEGEADGRRAGQPRVAAFDAAAASPNEMDGWR